MATLSSQKLATAPISVPALGQNRVKPSEYFSPIAQPVSISPAIRTISQGFIRRPALLIPCPGISADGP